MTTDIGAGDALERAFDLVQHLGTMPDASATTGQGNALENSVTAADIGPDDGQGFAWPFPDPLVTVNADIVAARDYAPLLIAPIRELQDLDLPGLLPGEADEAASRLDQIDQLMHTLFQGLIGQLKTLYADGDVMSSLTQWLQSEMLMTQDQLDDTARTLQDLTDQIQATRDRELSESEIPLIGGLLAALDQMIQTLDGHMVRAEQEALQLQQQLDDLEAMQQRFWVIAQRLRATCDPLAATVGITQQLADVQACLQAKVRTVALEVASSEESSTNVADALDQYQIALAWAKQLETSATRSP